MTPVMPALPGDDQHRAGADLRVGLHDLLRGGKNLGFFFLTANVLAIELNGERLGFFSERLIAGQEQTRRKIPVCSSARLRSREVPA